MPESTPEAQRLKHSFPRRWRTAQAGCHGVILNTFPEFSSEQADLIIAEMMEVVAHHHQEMTSQEPF